MYEYESYTIFMPCQINAYAHRLFLRNISLAYKKGFKEVLVDFSKVTHSYPNGMVPIISTIDFYKSKDIIFKIKLPRDIHVKELFISTNWAHLLLPKEIQEQSTKYFKHLAAKRFIDFQQQQDVVNEFMDIVTRNIILNKDIITALEWSINEITDNVLNHSDAKQGGIIQISSYPQNRRISFAVADSGRGIRKSLQESYPDIISDSVAIGEAVKSGVTRNPQYGQGNGLAGTLRIADLTKGSFSIISGKGQFNYYDGKAERKNRENELYYNGTIVAADIFDKNEEFSIEKALEFGSSKGGNTPNIIELNYLNDDCKSFNFKMKNESTGFGNRPIGRQLRTKVTNILNNEENIPIHVDWEGIPVISSSFADEFMGKLFLELGPLLFSSRVRNTKMEKLIHGLLDKAITQRLTQAIDE